MNYEFNILCYIRFLSGIIAVFLVFYIWKKRYSQGAFFLALFELAAAIWAISDGFEAASTTLNLKIFWSQVTYLGNTTSSVFFLMFAFHYTQQYRFTNRRILALLMIIPLLTFVLAITNPIHKLLWKEIIIIEATNQGVYYYGFWFWIFVFYAYGTLTTGIGILLFRALQVYRLYKLNFWLLLLASILPFCTSILYVFKLIPAIKMDLTPMIFILSGIIVFISLYRLKMFDFIPMARKHAFENLKIGILVADSNDRIVDSNPAFKKLAGLPDRKLIGSQVNDVLSDININFTDFTVQNEYTIETLIPIDGEQKYFEVNYHKVSDIADQLIGKIFILNDITTRKLILEAIADSNNSKKLELIEKEKLIKDLDAYARTVAHDLKNPIHSILGFSELIKIKMIEGKNDDVINFADIVYSQSRKMSNIIDDLLKLSVIRKEAVKLVPVDIRMILDEVTSRLGVQIADSRATIIKPDNWPLVMGYPQWIEEVWVNLITNAIKYGGNPPVITLGFEETSPDVCTFRIRDNGAGLPQSSIERIFEDFERLGRMDIEGHGLGLTIVKRIIEKLDGKVNVSSSNKPGEGCVFSFTLHKITNG